MGRGIEQRLIVGGEVRPTSRRNELAESVPKGRAGRFIQARRIEQASLDQDAERGFANVPANDGVIEIERDGQSLAGVLPDQPLQAVADRRMPPRSFQPDGAEQRLLGIPW